MKQKKLLIFALTILFLSTLVTLFTVQSRNNTLKSLKQAQALLEQNRVGEAGNRFNALKDSVWVKEQARLGLTLTGIVTGDKEHTFQLPERESVNLHDFHLSSLMEREFLAADFDGCMELAKIGQFYGYGTAALYYSASLLEKGETTEAANYYSNLPQRMRVTKLGVHLGKALELMENGARTIVRDRNGEIIGSIDSNGQFRFYYSNYHALIQPVVLQNILKNKIKKSLRLSIDLNLSHMALESLGKNKGSIVLVKPGTGEILAAVSDRRTTKKMGNGSSPAFEQMLEPASISKLITISAASRYKIDLHKEIAGKRCGGARRYDGKILWCPSALRKLRGLNHALAVSCNTSFADLGVKVGWEGMLAELRMFGFDSTGGNPFSLGKIVIPSGDARSLADLSIGLENTVTSPVHAALIGSVFANNGYWIHPEFVSAEDGFIGLTPRSLERIKGVSKGFRVLEKRWLPTIRGAMRAVVGYGGTAGYIAPSGLTVHMKTGTGGNGWNGFHTNYIGYAGDEKRVAFSVRLTGRRRSYQVRRATYDVNEALLTGLKKWFEKN